MASSEGSRIFCNMRKERRVNGTRGTLNILAQKKFKCAVDVNAIMQMLLTRIETMQNLHRLQSVQVSATQKPRKNRFFYLFYFLNL